MLEVLQFIFSSFWVWLGMMFLAPTVIGATGWAFYHIFLGLRGGPVCQHQKKAGG